MDRDNIWCQLPRQNDVFWTQGGQSGSLSENDKHTIKYKNK